MSKKEIKNKSRTYLLPLLSELIKFDKKFIDLLTNTFMCDDADKYKDHFYVEHKFDFKSPDFTAYEHELTNNELFVESIDIDDKVIYIFKFPEEYLHEYQAFKDSRYSAFGIDAKELILKFWTNIYEEEPAAIPVLLKIKQILFKEEKLKKQIEKELSSKRHLVEIPSDAELGEYVDVENETFLISNI